LRHLTKRLSRIRCSSGYKDKARYHRIRSYLSDHGTGPRMTDEQDAPVLSIDGALRRRNVILKRRQWILAERPSTN